MYVELTFDYPDHSYPDFGVSSLLLNQYCKKYCGLTDKSKDFAAAKDG